MSETTTRTPVQTISISQDGIWAGDGKLRDGSIECSAVLGPDGLDHGSGEQQEAAERAYDAIEDALGRGEDAVTVEGVRYTWIIGYTSGDLRDLPAASHVEIYEDNAGGLWFRPVGQGIVIEMPDTGDALSDCRLYGTDWDAADAPDAVYPEDEVLRHAPRHVATYRPDRDALDTEVEPHQMGTSARRYLGLDG